MSSSPLPVSTAFLTETGYGNFAVTTNGYGPHTSYIQAVTHSIGLFMSGISLPLAAYVGYDLFCARRRPLFVKRKDRYQAGNRGKEIWHRLPKAMQTIATVLLWPLFFSPQPNESLVFFFTLDILVTIAWHILLLTDTGSGPLRSLTYFMCPVLSSGGLLLHLVGIMRAIPVSKTASIFVSQGSRLQDYLFRLAVPSPGVLTVVIYFYSVVHVPLSMLQAWRLGAAQNWADMIYVFRNYWGQWAIWLSLFSLTATVYSLQLIWLLKVNAKDRKALGRDERPGLAAQGALTIQQKLETVKSKLASRSVSSTTPHSTSRPGQTGELGVSPAALGGPQSQGGFGTTDEGDAASSSSSEASRGAQSCSAAGPSNHTTSYPTTQLPIGTTLISAVQVAARPTANKSADAQRMRSLKQVKQILIDSPAVTMSYVPLHLLMIATYSRLPTNPDLVHSWLWILPVVANILAYAGAQLKVFAPLFFVVWRDRQARATGRGRLRSVTDRRDRNTATGAQKGIGSASSPQSTGGRVVASGVV